ncbi:hypothetical protein [Ekhidna lutea]|uniref:hypothetical protein n=1 Tax=Ekhidna lutea TaxID=447679 RepID=UPI000B77D82F|nr:hypothetical protein [Ekhidna lutea]
MQPPTYQKKIRATDLQTTATAHRSQLPPDESQLPAKNGSYHLRNDSYHQKIAATRSGMTATNQDMTATICGKQLPGIYYFFNHNSLSYYEKQHN